MGSLLVIAGPPGAGKSTVGELIADQLTPSALVEGDAFFRFLRNGTIEPWRPEAHEQNTIITGVQAEAARRFRAGGFETVYDGVLGPWFLDEFLRHAGGPFDYAIILPPVEACLHRISTRVGHEFDDVEATRSLHAQFATAAIDARHVFDSPTDDQHQMAAAILDRRTSGLLEVERATSAG